MLFNSYEFIFLFLPLTLLGFAGLLRRADKEVALGWLVAASLFFYGWWNPKYLVLILVSMAVNFALGSLLGEKHRDLRMARGRWMLLLLGLVFNLGLLGYFKYARFLVDNLNALTGAGYELPDIVLPLAISFFTFQQIAYLIDAYQGVTREYRFLHYALFVTFFPQLIAGPIVHHKEMLPQFMRRSLSRIEPAHLAVGITIFSIGLFKKAVLADGLAGYAAPVFSAAREGHIPTLLVAWSGALAYTLQLYFDFSGYSDMAIGAARMFGIVLPLNFHSPYKATSIIEFWRRWHMTLSRFLRDYLYIPLGGNRKGPLRRYLNLMVTMLLGGLWHGAGWTFVVWGGLHGLYLTLNHAWHRWLPYRREGTTMAARFGAWLLTFVAVVVGWVFFRAADLATAFNLLAGMAGFNGISLPNAIAARLGPLSEWLTAAGVEVYLGGGSQFVKSWLWLIGAGVIAFGFPNTQQWLSNFQPALDFQPEPRSPPWERGQWLPSSAWAVVIGVVSALGILALSEVSEFLYFQF